MERLNLFNEPIQEPTPAKNRSGSYNINPCLAAFGNGPQGKRCATCVHLITIRKGHTYFKCDQRKRSSSPATDHRKNWPACGKYVELPADSGLEVNSGNLALIRAQLVRGERHTVQSVLRSVGTQELRTYISLLKREGLKIASVWIKKKDKKFKEYFLEHA